MYILPKVHKYPLKLRPIVFCTNGPTEMASAFLVLQLYIRKVKSYISNSIELIRISDDCQVVLKLKRLNLEKFLPFTTKYNTYTYRLSLSKIFKSKWLTLRQLFPNSSLILHLQF